MKWKAALILFIFLFSSMSVIPPKSVYAEDPPIGWELLDGGKVLHIWNELDDYYFNISSGIQFSNHYNEYWSKNVMGIGYHSGGEWHVIYWTDMLSGFNKDLDTDNLTYVNATIWKDLTYNGYDFRLAIRYHIKRTDGMLTVQPYIKNLGQEIGFDLGFAWRLKEIKISNDYINDEFYTSWNVNENITRGESYFLNQTIDKKYVYNVTSFLIKDIVQYQGLEMQWEEKIINRTILTVKNKVGQYNAPITFLIKIGTLSINQEKTTNFLWHDADLIDSYSESNKDTYSAIKDFHPSDSAEWSERGQTFNCAGTYKITSAKFYLAKTGSPTGYAHAVLYAMTGTFGTNGEPTGSPLATSEGLDVSTLTGPILYTLYTLNFNTSEQYQMSSGIYCISFQNPTSGTIDGDNYVKIGEDESSPSHPGNIYGYKSGDYYPSSTRDLCFYVYGEVIGGVSYERNPTQDISWSSSIDRDWSLSRVLTQSLTWSSELSRKWILKRSFSLPLTFTYNAYGLLEAAGEFIRSISLGINWASNTFRRVDFKRTFTQPLTFTYNAIGSKWGEWIRSISLSIKWSSDLSRIVNFKRTILQTVSFSLSLPELAVRTIRIWVRTLQNVAIEDALVTLSEPSVGTILWSYYTDPQGYTPQEDLSSGEYTLWVTKEDFQPYNLLFNFTETTIVEVPLSTIEEGILISLNIELLIFTLISCGLSLYAWQNQDVNGMIAGAIAVITWFASGLWFMWTYVDTEKVHFWYLFEMFAFVSLFVTIRNILAMMDSAGKKGAWRDLEF